MQEINLKLTLDEVNLVLNALGNQPFASVYQLIEKINQQASPQVAPNMNGNIKQDEKKG